MSTGELCRSALRFIEDNERERSKSFENLKNRADNGVFSIQGRPPSQLEEMELLDALSTYFTLQREDLTKSEVFHQLFTYSMDHRRLEFLGKLTSLAVCISSAPVLDLVSVWIKCMPSSPRGPLILFSRWVLADLLSIDPAIDILSGLPKVSMTFAEAFLLGLTDTYKFLAEPGSPQPHSLLLRRLLSWLRHHRDAFLGQTWASGHARKVVSSAPSSAVSCLASGASGSDDAPGRLALVGLLNWTITQPLSRDTMGGGRGAANSNDLALNEVVAGIHYELLEHLESRSSSSSNSNSSGSCGSSSSGGGVIPLSSLERLVSQLSLATIPSTPASPTQATPPRASGGTISTSSPGGLTGGDDGGTVAGLDTCLSRLAEVVQIGTRGGLIRASPAQIEKILDPFRSHKFISIVISHLVANHRES